MGDSVLMFSGGLDSYIAWHYLGKPKAVYVALGHRYMEQELKAIEKLAEVDPEFKEKLIIDRTLNLGQWEQDDAFIPLRNLFLANVGALYGDRAYLIVQKGETDLCDRNRDFFTTAEIAVSKGSGKRFWLETPFWNMTKYDMVKWYVEKGLDTEKLLTTRSCYSTEEKPCGECSACIRRAIALELNGLKEEYLTDPKKTPLGLEYLERANSARYIDERNEQIKAWFGGGKID